MSTSSTYVKWAAVTLDFAIFSKMRFLSPWIGIRCSLPLGATAAAGGGATTVVLVGPWAALRTSSSLSRPCGPLPRTAARFTFSSFARRRTAGAARTSPVELGAWCLRSCRRRWRGGRSGGLGPGRDGLARLSEHDEGAADLHDLALFRAELKDLSGDGRWDLNGHLIRHDLDDRVVFLDGVSLFHEPLDDLAFVDALPDVGELELAGHRLLSRCVRPKPRGRLNILCVP